MMPASNAGVGMNIGFPDVCLTPAAPSPIPVPYPNLGANAQELPPAGGGRILFSGCPAHNMGGKPVMTSGDEGGTAHPMFKMPGGCMVGNPKILLGGMPAEHLTTPSFGNNYNDGLGSKLVPSVTNVLLTGLGDALTPDERAAAWTPSGLQALHAELTGGSVPGLGLTLAAADDDGPRVVHVRAGGLGARLGLQAGDRLLRLDGAPVEAWRPAGREVELVVRRAGTTRALRGFTGAAPSLTLTTRPDGVARLTLRRCALGAPAQVRAALGRLRGARRVVLDLRGNPGGCLWAAAGVAGAFLEPGLPFATVDVQANSSQLVVAGPGPVWRGPLTVWIDGGTASAAEALAAALADHGRARLVGAPSFGKGVGEQVLLAAGRAHPTGRAVRVRRPGGRPLRRLHPGVSA